MARVPVPDVGRVAAKWARRAGGAGQDYADGVNTTPRSWQANATAAKASWSAGVQEAIAKDRFSKGVTSAGDAKWKSKTVEKGPARFSQGVSIAEPDYSSQVAPYLQAIGAVDLPPRGATGSEGNFLRVAAIGKALRALKVSR